jgi:hypothetical protein
MNQTIRHMRALNAPRYKTTPAAYFWCTYLVALLVIAWVYA